MLNVQSAKKIQTNPSTSNVNTIPATPASRITSQSKLKGISILTKQNINKIQD
jgi:hypothetical protein